MKSYKNDFLCNRFFLNKSFLALLLFVIAYFFQYRGLFPNKGVASSLPPSNTGVTLQKPSIRSR